MRVISSAAAAGASPNFEPSWPVSTCACVSAVTPGMMRTSTSCARPAGTVASSRSTSSPLSTTTRPIPCSTASAISSSVLALPCRTRSRRVGACLERGDDLAAAGDVEPEALLDHHPLHGGARERLRGEHHPRVRPPRGELAAVFACPRAQRRLATRPGPACRTPLPASAAGSRRRPASRPRRPRCPAGTATAGPPRAALLDSLLGSELVLVHLDQRLHLVPWRSPSSPRNGRSPD